MNRDEFQKVRIQVTFLTVFLVMAAAFVLLCLDRLTVVSFTFLVLGASCMTAHWWLLGSLVRSLVEGRRYAVAVRGMLSVFPAGAALSVVFVSLRIDRMDPLPALLGLFSVPFAVTLVCLQNGIVGLRTAFAVERAVHG